MKLKGVCLITLQVFHIISLLSPVNCKATGDKAIISEREANVPLANKVHDVRKRDAESLVEATINSSQSIKTNTMAFFSLENDSQVVEDMEESKRKNGKHDNTHPKELLPGSINKEEKNSTSTSQNILEADTNQNLIRNADQELNAISSAELIQKSKPSDLESNTAHAKNSGSSDDGNNSQEHHANTLLEILKLTKPRFQHTETDVNLINSINSDSNRNQAVKDNSGAKNKNPNAHLSSAKHDEMDQDVRIAMNYAASIAAKFFGSSDEEFVDSDEDGPTLFTVANSNVGRDWETIPYREKFQWSKEDAPCFTFTINIPDERTGHGSLPICIFRQHLEYLEESALIIHGEDKHFNVFEQRERKVSGQVNSSPGSTVYGRFVESYFYGEISMKDPVSGEQTVYVVEEIKLLSRLLQHSNKLVNNLLAAMQDIKKRNDSEVKFNAVVTKGVSILSFMSNTNPNSLSPFRPFVILSTSQNSYITSGEPNAKLDENGRLIFDTRGNIVTIDTDGSVKLTTQNKEYTFRPRGKTMVSQGLDASALRELEGVVTITAITGSMTYSCVLPSPSFTKARHGGFLCKVCLAADSSFREKYLDKLGDNGTVSNFLGNTIDKVSWIFRSVDWNGDNKSDNVGLDYDLQYHHWNYRDDDEEEVSPEGLEVLFKSLTSVDFSDCCLGISYTMKMFPPAIYAKSSPSKPMAPGGACAIRNDGQSNNAILISANNKEGNFSILTEEELIYITAREVAKAFGAQADTSGQAGCDSFVDSKGENRHFLLWPDVTRNITPEEKSFSTCSVKSIYDALSSCKSSCFDVDHYPFCGNGIQEEGEECDCGNEYECSKQYCCFGRTGKFPCRRTGADCQFNSTANLNYHSPAPFYILSVALLKLQF